MKILNIGQDFHNNPSGRFYADGPGSGEEFREEHLKPSLFQVADGQKLTVILDDEVEGYGSSFLTEGFAGIVKFGYMRKEDFLNKIDLAYTDEDFEFYKNKIIQYIKEAKFGSEQYIPTMGKK